MSRQPRIFRDTMSLHYIKGKTQLRFAEQHADFIANNLETLIANTDSVAPVRKKPYALGRNSDRSLTSSASPLEKHWEEAIFRKWEKVEDGLDPLIPFRKVVSYQVMLRDTNKDDGWGEIDLFGATAENVPVAIELKADPSKYLLDAIVEVLAYGIAIRKAWRGPLCSQWARDVGEINSLVDLPLVVMAPASYWKVVLSDSTDPTRYKTPLPARRSIKKLLEKMHRANYPLNFVEVNSDPEPDNSELPVIINAVVKDLPVPTSS